MLLFTVTMILLRSRDRTLKTTNLLCKVTAILSCTTMVADRLGRQMGTLDGNQHFLRTLVGCVASFMAVCGPVVENRPFCSNVIMSPHSHLSNVRPGKTIVIMWLA